MLMSKSRLEKFLYALYSLDSSDLPTPLSRIEELYKCWVTGEETPTFEPLSRVEKYLMAILGVYDVDSIPNPISRVEVLLYKLATGDDNLDDVEIFLSEHEELLAEIIRNDGAGGNIDIEYVLYTLSTESNTLYNTAEKPVKSAILKGQTLVNVLNPETINFDGVSNLKMDGGNFTYDVDWEWGKFAYIINGKPNTSYLIKHSEKSDGTYILFRRGDDMHLSAFTDIEEKNQLVTTDDSGQFVISIEAEIVGTDFIIQNLMVFEYQNGMENWDIPYFEGMKSVQMPVLKTNGKNLFDVDYMKSDMKLMSIERVKDGIRLKANESQPYRSAYSRSFKVESGKYYNITYTVENENPNNIANITLKKAGGGYFPGFYDCTITGSGTTSKTFLAGDSGYVRPQLFASLTADNGDYYITYTNVMISEVSSSSNANVEHEPYKSNILTANEPVELRRIGDVKDELDLVTGEVTQRIGEVVFDGSEYWAQSGMGGSPMFYTSLNDMAHKRGYLNSISCDKLTTYAGEAPLNDSASPNGIAGYIDVCDAYPNENWIYIKCADSGDSVEKLKQWLSQNPITVQYELTTPVAKTVDLSVVDQDGSNTKLSTFDDITHVTLSSEGLIPEAELEVATKNEEVLSTLSLEMDDISTTQNDLQETSNTQSENVDATMIATTEIYEGLL